MAHTSQTPAPKNVPSPESADRQAQDTLYYRHVLHELIEFGADLARMLHREATAAAEAIAVAEAAKPAKDPANHLVTDPFLATRQDFTTSFDRIARAIRRTITLARKLAEPLPAPVDPATDRVHQHRAAARRRIIRAVEDAIQRARRDSDAENLHAELVDRLDGPDLDDDIQLRPIADIIADICRDLGIAAAAGTHPWKRRTPQDIAALCELAAMPSRTRPQASLGFPLPANSVDEFQQTSAPNTANQARRGQGIRCGALE